MNKLTSIIFYLLLITKLIVSQPKIPIATDQPIDGRIPIGTPDINIIFDDGEATGAPDTTPTEQHHRRDPTEPIEIGTTETTDTFTTTSQELDLEDVVNDLREELREEFSESGRSMPLLATTVRLIFADCSGSTGSAGQILDIFGDESYSAQCNGCIDFENPDNAGLVDGAVNDLEHIYTESRWNDVMSRADFWAAAATIAVEYAQGMDENTNDTLPEMTYYFGRQDCDTNDSNAGSDADTNDLFPQATNGWAATARWFSDNLDFAAWETVAILGAHTLGQAHSQYTGYSDLSWVRPSDGRQVLDNAYYVNLLNSKWSQSRSAGGKYEFLDARNSTLMLNSDIGLLYNIDPYINELGQADRSEFEWNNETIRIIDHYAGSNEDWLADFGHVFDRLITTGYDVNDLQAIVPNTDNISFPIFEGSEAGEFAVTDANNLDEESMNAVDTLNKYAGVLALVALIGVILVLMVLILQMCCRRCCGRGNVAAKEFEHGIDDI